MPLKKLRLVPEPLAVGAVVVSFAIVAIAWLVDVQVAVFLFGALALGGAVARVVMPAQKAFAVRRRAVDVAMLGALGLALLFLAYATPLG